MRARSGTKEHPDSELGANRYKEELTSNQAIEPRSNKKYKFHPVRLTKPITCDTKYLSNIAFGSHECHNCH